MRAERFNTQPVEELLQKHLKHLEPYTVEFKGRKFIIHPEVFNPTYTKVSGFLADNVEVHEGQSVLEMFCGSGAVGLTVAQEAKSLVGVDISEKAVVCSTANAALLGLDQKSKFRHGSLWQVIASDEKFDVILANPPLLPAIPETLLEMAVADSPTLNVTTDFIVGCSPHLSDTGSVYMAFSNASKVYFDDPLSYIESVAGGSGLQMKVKAEWDVGYEIYRILQFRKKS